MKKIIYGILLLLTAGSSCFWHFRMRRGLETIRFCLERFGVNTTFHSIMSNAHTVEFFLFRFVLCLFDRECGWRWWVILLVEAGTRLIDRSMKILFPNREFDVVDLTKD